MAQLAFCLTPLKTFTEPMTFDQCVTVEPHPDKNGLVALKYADGLYASWRDRWDQHKITAGADERFLISGNLLSAYRAGGTPLVAVFGCVGVALLP